MRGRREVGEIEQLREEIRARFGSAEGKQQARPLACDAREAPVDLATVHKAKGLGWGVVFLLEPQELPLRFVMDAGGWPARQELNVQYVAYTRSEATLVLLKDVIPPGHRPEGWSLKAAIESVLFEEGEDAGGCAARRGRTYTEEERSQAAWESWDAHCNHGAAEAAAAGAAGGTTGPPEMSVAKARSLLELRTEEEQPAGQLQLQEILRAFRRRSLKMHPDRAERNGLSVERATERFRQLVHAKEVLETENAQLAVDDVAPPPRSSSPPPRNDSSPPASPSSAPRPPATPTTARARARATGCSAARATAGSTPKRRQPDSPAGEPSPRRTAKPKVLDFEGA